MTRNLTLYSRKDCCLCEVMKHAIRQASEKIPVNLEEIDVDGSAELQAKYGDEVPVLFIDGKKAFKYRAVHSPDVIVVDEPMVGLDPRAARLIKNLLRAFVDQGGTVFLSTHTLEVAETLCDRIAILHQGRIRALGTMSELRAEAAAGTAGLEEVFLKLTGSEPVTGLIAALRSGRDA